MNTLNMASALIGGAYGDEAKGLVVDVLTAKAERHGVVVRSNGGAQAGHSVATRDGRRHTFHHVGSGALAGASTHLSAHFVLHPMFLLEEREHVLDLGGCVDITCDPRALVTTPFDILINQAVEVARGVNRHGSCGMGFGETIERNLRPEFAIPFHGLLRPDLRDRLIAIRTEWVPLRLKALGVEAIDEQTRAIIEDDRVVDRFIADCNDFLAVVRFMPDRRIRELGNVIFEGAQGLQLDQDYGAFPFVTRSNCGLRNMIAIAKEAGIGAIEVVYVTRAYTTRHGAGPLAHERVLDNFRIIDPTNQPNDWQGSIRHADLDVDDLAGAIRHDLTYAANTGITVTGRIAVSCLDQAIDMICIFKDGVEAHLDPATAAAEIAQAVGLPLFGESWGPTRDTFRLTDPAPQQLAA